jgi:hypothetical protein
MKRRAMETTRGAFICTAVFLLLTALEAPRAVAVDAVTDDTVAGRISAAKTAADHEAIAAYYHAQAAEKAKQVKHHEAMLKSYDNVAGVSKELMRNHCQTLISTYRQAEQSYEGLAAEHEKLAKAAGAGH